MIYIRSLFANVFFFGTIFVGSLFAPFVALGPKKWSLVLWDKIAMPVCFFFLKLFAGLKIEFRGLENISKDPVLYACKHESSLETYSFTQAVPTTSYVLKKELTYIPFFGWSQYFYGMIPIDRRAGSAAMKYMLKGVQKRLSENRPVIIFPEGTRCRPGTTKGYKSGFLFVAETLNLKVVPVAVNTGLFWTKNSFLRYSGTAVFEFLEPMEVSKNTDKKAFMAELEKRIEAKCAELNEEAVRKYPWVAKNLG
jgi:1-acyl-sn-glycerol-3-phosphate acyltransferase